MRNRSRSVLAFVVFSSLVALGCAGPEKIAVSSNFDPLASFPAQATYTWKVDAQSLPDDPRMRTEEMDARIRSAADAEFAKHGYRVVDPGPGDYVMSYQFRVYTFQSTDVSTSTGTLSIEIVESRSGRRVWTGYGRAEFYLGLTESESGKRLGDAMARMLEGFPPNQRPDE